MINAQAIAAQLIMERHVPKDQLTILRNPDVRRDVEKRLAECGLQLLADFYATDYSIRPFEDVRQQFEELSLGDRLNADEYTALVLVWCRLVWPQIQEISGDYDFSESTFIHEFQDIFPNASQSRRILTRLLNLDYLSRHSERGTLEAGPAMWSTIDHARMKHFVEERAQLVAARDRALQMTDRRQDIATQVEEMVLALLRGTANPLHLREIYGELGRGQKETREALERLRAKKKVRIVDPEKKKFSRWEAIP